MTTTHTLRRSPQQQLAHLEAIESDLLCAMSRADERGDWHTAQELQAAAMSVADDIADLYARVTDGLVA